MLKLFDGRHHIVNHRHHRHHFHGFRHHNHNHHRQHHYHHNQHHYIRIRIKCYRSQSLYSSRSNIAPTTSVTCFQGQQSAMLNRNQQSQLLQHFYFSTKTNNVNLSLNSSTHHHQQQLYHINSHILSRISNQQRLYHRHHQQLQQQHVMKNMVPKKIVSLAINEYIYILIRTTALIRCITT